MNILILNWRDSKNPESGGAEVLTHEMAKRWVDNGHAVVQFSALFDGAKAREHVDGVQIIRRGSADIRSLSMPVHLAAYLWYKKQPRGCFDVVVDEIHGVPFFTPWYIREKKVALICEVAKEIWDATFPFPLNRIGRAVESNYYRAYKNVPFLTISRSTKQELLEMGIKNNNITILPMGLNVPDKLRSYPKEKEPTLLFVARLTKAKGIEDALRLMVHMRSALPNVRLWVVGQGDPSFTRHVHDMAGRLKVNNCVKFWGYISQEKKFELMARAHVLIVPSMKEGWGLTVPEAGYVGTPAVGYNVEGLRDVIVDGKTGLLTPPSPSFMSQDVLRLLRNTLLYRKLQKGTQQLAKSYTWDKAAEVALSVLQKS